MIQILSSNLPLGLDGYLVTAEQSFIDGLTTQRGSVIGKPDYGTDLPRLKHKAFGSDWLIEFRRCLKDACKHDPRLEFKSALINDSEVGAGKLYFDVQIGHYILKGLVNV
ncbi:MAG: hypothetical protein JJV95_04465 [Sulfurospirillum sp.]|nr:hypothetical protein [Sulfurospirillum sp.]